MSVMAAPMTRADLELMPDDGRRYELLDGVLIVGPTPIWRHQFVVSELLRVLLAVCPDDMMTFTAPLDCVFDDLTVLQPDVLVMRRADLGPRTAEAPPVLAIEVLSPSTRRFDLMTKRSRYEAGGTLAYWVVDPDGPELTAWELRDGAYVQVARFRGAGRFETAVPFPISLDVEVLGPDAR